MDAVALLVEQLTRVNAILHDLAGRSGHAPVV